MIPNTTPTPNELYNGEMRKMSDAELRVVLLVTRSTLGWELDHKTGMRKVEDWISHSQLTKRTGKSSRAISYAVANCVEKGWIETRTNEGIILKTPDERKKYGKKIYYRLGKIFLDKVTIANDAKVKNRTIANDAVRPSQPLRTTKETITKDIFNTNVLNSKSSEFAGLNDLIKLFEKVNPEYEQLYKNTTQRNALSYLLGKYGDEKTRRMIDALPSVITEKYAPTITTPLQLKNKLPQLFAFVTKNRANSKVAPVFQK